MINFFSAPSTDASLKYLSTIFGNVNGVIPGTGGDITILGTMFRTFNATLLTIGALIIVYITVVGIMMTAHEGEFMKKWNSLWTPLRAVFGIAALVPTASGFCGIQILMMWVIVQGVGAADTLWNTVLGYVTYAGSPFAQISVSNAGVSGGVANIYKALVCDQSARAGYRAPYEIDPQTGGYYCNNNQAWCSTPTNIDASNTARDSFAFGPNGSCGTLTYCNQSTACANASSLECQTCRAQVTALEDIITTLRGAAELLVRTDYEYQNYYMNGYITVDRPNPNVRIPDWVSNYCNDHNIPPQLCRGPAPASALNSDKVPGGLPDPLAGAANPGDEVIRTIYWPYAIKPIVGSENFISTGVSYYMNAVGSAYSTYISTLVSDSSALTGQYKSAQETGWIFAGAYYYTIAADNQKNIAQSLPRLEVNTIDPQTGTPENPNSLKDFRNNAAAARELIRTMQGTSTGPGGESAEILADGASAISSALFSATDASSGSNPLVQLAAAGYGLLFAAQILFVAFLGISIALGIISGINAFVLGTGGFNPMAVATPVLYMILVPLLAALLGLLVSMGATLGVYVPLIPYTIFTFGAIGWLTSTIETMVAGPLVAVGILAPGGHHELLGKAEPALMLLFNVFLRPSLMIFGLIAAMLLASVVVTMINAMFFTVMFQIIGAGTGSLETSESGVSAGNQAAAGANILEMIMFLIAYVGLIISALNKAFAAIHIIPEKVMRWISGQGEQYGEGEAVGEMKRGVEGGAQAAGGAMKGAGKQAEALGESSGKKKAAREFAESEANKQKLDKEKEE